MVLNLLYNPNHNYRLSTQTNSTGKKLHTITQEQVQDYTTCCSCIRCLHQLIVHRLRESTGNVYGLPPAFEVDQTDLAYPKQTQDSPDEIEEFSDADFLTARIKLTTIQIRNLNSASHIGLDDA
ncbi:unnamed protein product [Clonostachys rhizophaga]|uniref:Uncharacterized protein n=1 Tax=Clonostachys rhizophaga TaxID=160324 RepID=A0A9N9W3M1_9HYPO|nr:unnamed protein product [Clonostachys rhizophaga]